MNVACPSCSTRYSVDDARIPPSGVTIKCPKCQHVFVAKRDAAPPADAAVALPGNAAAGSRGGPVALPGTAQARSQPAPVPIPGSAAKKPSADLADLDLGLESGLDLPAPKEPTKPAKPPARPPAKNLADALDFIDATADKRGPQDSTPSAEFRVRRRNGRVEGPFGVGRMSAMLRNKELSGGEDISEDGHQWRSITSQPELNAVINAIAQESELSFGNVDLPAPIGQDLPGLKKPRAPQPPPVAPSRSAAPSDRAAATEVGSSADLFAGEPPASEPLGFGSDGLRSGPRPSQAASPPPPSAGFPSLDEALGGFEGTGDPLPEEREIKRSITAHPPASDGLEVGDVPDLPPFWRTYKKLIIAFGSFLVLFLGGFVTHVSWHCGAFGTKCIAAIFQPPPPPAPEAPPPPPAKLADAKEIAGLIDEGSFEAFRSVFATIEKLGPSVPDNMLAVAKARGLATLAYGKEVFPIEPLTKSVEALNTIDMTKALGGDTTRANLEIQKARAALDIIEGKQAQAIAQLEGVLASNSGDKEVAYLLGYARIRANAIDSALQALDKAIVTDPKYAPALHAFGDAVLATGDEKNAAAWYSKALAAEPAHTRSALAAAALYNKLNDAGAERRTLALGADGVARGLQPEKRAAYLFEAASAYARAGQAARAVSWAEEAQRLEPANGAYASLAAYALAEKGDTKAALALIEPVVQRETRMIEPLLARALAYSKTDELFTKAFVDYEAARKIAPDDPRPYIEEARFDTALSKLSDARQALAKAVLLPRAGARPFVDLGRIDLAVGDVDAAIKDAQQAVKAEPNNASSHALLGDCYLVREQVDDAIKSYEIALKLDDEHLPARLGYANALRDSGDRGGKSAAIHIAEAIPVYLRVLEENPRNPTVMFEYGRALELQNNLSAALALYREAAALDEKDVRPHLRMAAAYLEQDPPNVAEAAASVATARRIDATGAKQSGHVQFWEGRVALLENRAHDAEAALRSAVEAEPRNALFHYWLGRALEANNSLLGSPGTELEFAL